MTFSNLLLGIDPDDLLNLTRALVDTPSVSKEEELLCDNLEEYISSYRSDAKIMRFNNTLVVQVNFEKSDELPIIFAGHIDTVPPAHNGDSSKPARIDGDLLYGLGSSDMKSGIAVMLRLLKNIEVKSSFIFYEGEEISDQFNGLNHLALSNRDMLQAKWAVLLEPTDGNLELGCQGSMNATVAFKGIAAHSARPYMGVNAIYEALETLEKIKQISEQIEEVEINSFIYKESLQVTKISGGNAANVLPDNVSFNLNYRFLPSKSKQDVEAYVNEVCSLAETIDYIDILEGAMPAHDHPLVEIAKSRGVDTLSKVGWTDVARFFALGISAINCGPGLVKLCHRADEHTSIKLLDSSYELLSELIKTS